MSTYDRGLTDRIDDDRRLDDMLDLLKPAPAPSDMLRARLGHMFSRGTSNHAAVGATVEVKKSGRTRRSRSAAVAAALVLAVAGGIAMPPAKQTTPVGATIATAVNAEQDLADIGLVGSDPSERIYTVALVGPALGDSDAAAADDGSLSEMPLE